MPGLRPLDLRVEIDRDRQATCGPSAWLRTPQAQDALMRVGTSSVHTDTQVAGALAVEDVCAPR